MIEKTVGRQSLAAQAEPSPQAPHAALLVDFDNVTMGIRSDLQTQLRKLLNSDIIRGKVSVQRAYADWRRYPQYIVPLTEASIDLIFAPAVGANKKNATDIRLAIDALELVFTRPEIGTFILLSGDSDFSALVLKLKEYGKFVIGVGIRESSSDLLVQNCDEYYSYNELTGLARTGEEEIVRHDPWELVVEAVQKMLKSGDVMRSDRLKQVMQSIDPNFDEKDAGCNRFSKFVVEAEKRGLLRLTKMENGQYAVDVGPNANVAVDHQTATETKPSTPDTAASSQRRKRTTRTRSDRETKARTLTLSESFDLLKRALKAVGAVGDEATVADRARDGMIEIHGNESDPVFDPKRFQRMLRQAHDADVIELIKSNGDDYMLKLSVAVAEATAEAEAEAGASAATDVAGAVADTTAAAEEEPKKTTKRKTTKRKTTKKKTTKAKAEAGASAATDVAGAVADATASAEEEPKKATKRKTTKRKTTKKKAAASAAVAADAAGAVAEATASAEGEPKKATKGKTTKRKTTKKKAAASDEPKAAAPIVNPRFRRGSRSAKPKAATAETSAEPDKQEEAPPPTPSPKVSTGPRTLGMRSGSRRSRQPAKQEPASGESTEKAKAQPEPQTEAAKPPETKLRAEPEPVREEVPKAPAPEVAVKPEPKPEPTPQAKTETTKEPEPDEDGSGLFRKVTAAFQRAMGTAKEEDE